MTKTATLPSGSTKSAVQASRRNILEVVLVDYGGVVEDFESALGRSISDYSRMLAKQSYILAAVGTIKETAEISSHSPASRVADLLKAAARSYLDESDQRAHEEGTDNRFILEVDQSNIFRSRLMRRAEQSRRIWSVYCRNLEKAEDLVVYALNFMLEVALALPIGAWECACCLAAAGRCEECGYARDHNVCTSPGSTYEMLNRTHQALVKSIRMRVSPGAGGSRRPFESTVLGPVRRSFDVARPHEEVDLLGCSDVVSGVYD